ncbi:pilus assembly protein TadG-related protein [Phenylobacterium sp.]|uniref:pilus assembly protein TadG-related protein n=1 Tax=Phenylobacterium sp. TaxID=1871053 RepID=UPI0035B227B2
MIVFRILAGMVRSTRGSVSPLLTLMLAPLIGVLGMAAEASSWFLTQRAMQNAADSAAIAAATNGCDAADSCHTVRLSQPYDSEAKSVAAKFGFVDGADNTTVTASNTAPCPDGSAKCYSVTITRLAPIYLVRLVGFNGDAALGGGRAQTIQAYAVASGKSGAGTYCLLALASGGPTVDGISTHGSPKADFTGCNVATNGNASCKGHDLKADASDAGGTTSDCAAGGTGTTGVDPIPDPYADLADQIPANTCSPAGSKSTYPQDTGKKNSPTPASNKLSGSLVLTSTPKIYCGDVVLTGNLSVSTPADGGVIVVENGSLNIPSGMTLSTAAGSGLTIIFSGPTVSGLSPTHTLVGGGTIDIAAPTTGDWSGIAMVQDPALTSGIDWSAAGNSPTWDITGLIYMPNADVTFSGVVNKASNGHDCFALVVDTFLSNGTATILEHQSECAAAGLTPPSGPTSARPALVQ